MSFGRSFHAGIVDGKKELRKWFDRAICVSVFLGYTSTGRVGLWFCGLYVQEHLKAQPAVVLVLKLYSFRYWL